jgi:hypothetical protein
VRRDNKVLHKVAWEYQRLKQLDPRIAKLLQEYILSEYRDLITDPRVQEKNVYRNTYYSLHGIHGNKRSVLAQYRKAIRRMPFNDIMTVVTASLTMDIYTIARMLVHGALNQTKEIVSYTGSAHTDRYVEFLEMLGGKSIRKIKQESERCAVVPLKQIKIE